MPAGAFAAGECRPELIDALRWHMCSDRRERRKTQDTGNNATNSHRAELATRIAVLAPDRGAAERNVAFPADGAEIVHIEPADSSVIG